MDCRLCEIGCIIEHSQMKDIIKAFREKAKAKTPDSACKRAERYGISPNRGMLARTLVEANGPLQLSAMCRHCEKPECLHACITGAISKKPDGRVVIDPKRCVACWSCIMACHWGVIERNENEGQGIRHSHKCDLCPDRETPACVDICPNSALLYEER